MKLLRDLFAQAEVLQYARPAVDVPAFRHLGEHLVISGDLARDGPDQEETLGIVDI